MWLPHVGDADEFNRQMARITAGGRELFAVVAADKAGKHYAYAKRPVGTSESLIAGRLLNSLRRVTRGGESCVPDER